MVSDVADLGVLGCDAEVPRSPKELVAVGVVGVVVVVIVVVVVVVAAGHGGLLAACYV